MRFSSILIIFCLTSVLSGCNSLPDCTELYNRIESEHQKGNFSKVKELADSLAVLYPGNNHLVKKADSIVQISERIRLDFSLTEDQFISRIESYKLPVNDSILNIWNKKKWTEWRMIDGEKRYFNRSASNLRLLKLFYEGKEQQNLEQKLDPEMIERMNHTKEILTVSQENPYPVCPVNMIVTYTITVEPDVVPEGEVIRCWLPWPRKNHPRQHKVELLSASENDYIFSPDSMIHSSIYMEQKSVKGNSAVFNVSFRYQSSGQYINPETIKAGPYNKESLLYKKYTSQELPQIHFSENIKKRADDLTSDGDTPAEIVRKLYLWFKDSIPWTGALEYSTMPDIPGYVLSNRRGDCGMQTLLYMSMLRYKGIPVRWQSGWMVPPGHENLHDWCEIYFEGIGWIPSDISYDLQMSEDQNTREFFMSGIDSYRLIVNDGIAGKLYPEKLHLRSEPYDFQRGEVEWKGGNLYFDKWDYKMRIEFEQ